MSNDGPSVTKIALGVGCGIILALILVTSMCLNGCAPTVIRIRPTTIHVADTADAKACERQCMQIESSCIPGCNVQVSIFRRAAGEQAVRECLESCAARRDYCLTGCPGAATTASDALQH